MVIRAVFADLDGTTVDTEARNRRAIEAEALKGGYKFKPRDWDTLAGQGDGIIWEKLAQRRPSIKKKFATAADFVQAVLDGKLARIDEVKKIEETGEALSLFKNHVEIVAAVSNANEPDAKASLDKAGYSTSDFAFCMFREDIDRAGLRAKPYPDPYIEALRRANEMLAAEAKREHREFIPIKPEECLVLEDSKTGVRAGLAAGMHVIQMTNETPALDDAEAETFINTHGGTYHPLDRSELVTRCYTLLGQPPVTSPVYAPAIT
ncbi:MAG TPA: HAD family phosphatase [Patescibacteria group bacterium]|jgi:HAD superfamily hydrolase (TIGR01509 family)|nr:HAD family phosphatase [Patescibacteria group bacterium]